MATVKRLVCLANSRKLSGRCIAGIEVDRGHKRPGRPGGQRLGWIRPVSAREHEEVSEHERQYKDGSDPRVRDVIDVPLLDPVPKSYQQENWLLDPERYWQKVTLEERGREPVVWGDLERFADPAAPLWIDGHHTRPGRNDKIPLELASDVTTSLRLVRIDRLTLVVFKPGETFGNSKRRVQGRFVHHGTQYRLWVTDPRYEEAYLAKPDGDYQIGESFLTVSLGEPYKDACYKLIAAIITPDDGPSA